MPFLLVSSAVGWGRVKTRVGCPSKLSEKRGSLIG